MWGKTYQCQISNAGVWFIGVRFSKFHDFPMTFDDFLKFHDFPWLFQKILFFQVFQVFQTLWEPCHHNEENPQSKTKMPGKPQILPVSLSQNSIKIRKIYKL